MEKYNDRKYQFGRAISSIVFNTTLHPKIYGLEKIPKEGPLIFCGNHLHVWDQYPVMCATKHTIHWMAKKEYFDGKMGPIFAYMGCICVDRENNPHAAKEEAIAYLKEGSNIGLFPEGTRNCLKGSSVEEAYNFLTTHKQNIKSLEEFASDIKLYHPRTSQITLICDLVNASIIDDDDLYNHFMHANDFLNELCKRGVLSNDEYVNSLLLPFKFGAVSMAKETDATIVPFAVTGEYKLGNKDLMVNFGEPFKVVDENLADSNNELEHKVKMLLLENYKR